MMGEHWEAGGFSAAEQFREARRERDKWEATVDALRDALERGEITPEEFENTRRQADYAYRERLKRYPWYEKNL